MKAIVAIAFYILISSGNLKYSEEIYINSNIETVFNLIDDPYKMKEYMNGIESYEVLHGELREPGSKAKITYKWGEYERIMIEEIITKKIPEKITVTYKSGGVFNTVTNKLIKISENKTKFINEQEFQFEDESMRLMRIFNSSAFNKQSKIYLKNFKSFAENQN